MPYNLLPSSCALVFVFSVFSVTLWLILPSLSLEILE